MLFVYYGELIDRSVPDQSWTIAAPKLGIADPWKFFFLIIAGSVMARDAVLTAKSGR